MRPQLTPAGYHGLSQVGRHLTDGAKAPTLSHMDDSDRSLLDRLQNELPLVERPWAALAADIAMPEDELLERISRLREEGVVRQISAIFDTRRLGYQSALVAARSKPGTQQLAAGRQNRNSPYNAHTGGVSERPIEAVLKVAATPTRTPLPPLGDADDLAAQAQQRWA